MLSVSVITPSLNQGRFIERTIRSVIDQAYAPLEYVVVDGGSSDGTLDVLRRYEHALRWTSGPDGGQADAVNKGIHATTGEVIGWLNSDDVYLPDAVKSATAYLASHPEIDVVYGQAHLVDEHDHVLGRYYTEPWNVSRLLETCYLCQPAVFFRRRVVERFGGLDDRLHYCMDYEYWLRLAGAGATFGYLEQLLASSRLYAGNKTLGSRLAVHEEINRMLKARLGRVPDAWLTTHAHAVVELQGVTHQQAPVRFACRSSLAGLNLSLQWNRGISRHMAVWVGRRLAGAAVARLRSVSR